MSCFCKTIELGLAGGLHAAWQGEGHRTKAITYERAMLEIARDLRKSTKPNTRGFLIQLAEGTQVDSFKVGIISN